MTRTIAAILAALVLAAPPAAAFTASNGLPVAPAAAGEFTVGYAGFSAPGAFWCAAADFAVQELGAGTGTRLYRLSEPPRGSGEGIRFALAPRAGQASKTGLLLFGTDDGSLPLSHAAALCDSGSLAR